MFDFIKNKFKSKKESSEKIDSIYIVSYPRSGNTWMRFLIANYFTDANLEFKNDQLLRLIPDIHVNPQGIENTPLKPKFIKSHFLYQKEYKNVIYLLRDARDVAVSYYHYQLGTKTIPAETDFKTYLKNYFLPGNTFAGAWSEHIRSWKSQKKSRVFFLKYEELFSDTENSFKKILQFFDLPVDENKIKKTVNNATFEAMQKKHEVYKSTPIGQEDTRTPIKFIRNGKLEDWKNYFDEKMLKEFNQKFGKTMRKCGYIS